MDIKVEVNLFAYLRTNRFEAAHVTIKAPATVNSLLELLGINHSEIGAIFINGRDGRFQQPLADGDRVTLLPCIGGG